MQLNYHLSAIKKASLLRGLFIYALLFLFIPFSQASVQDTSTMAISKSEQILNQANEKSLSTNKKWLALLHYNRGGTLRDRHRSYIDSPDFFLSAQGDHDANAELVTSINLLLLSSDENRCKFVARYRFLYENLIGSDWKNGLAHCQEYKKFREIHDYKHMSLIFPGPYLNAPSSMFGHTLLKLDANKSDSSLLSSAINFGANTPKDVHPMEYIGKGVFGGFPGDFKVIPYFSKIQEYTNGESRDIWEYELNLTEDDIELILQHLWELQNVNFNYYYLDENCSYRLLELISVARPELTWMEDLRFAELPLHTVQAFKKAGLIKQRQWRPSILSEVNHYLNDLNAQEKDLLQLLLADANTDLSSLEESRQAAVLSTAYKLYRFQNRENWHQKEVSRQGLALLKKRSEHSSTALTSPTEPVPPEIGHLSKRLQLRQSNNLTELSYRFAYHDLLDNFLGFSPGFGLEALNLTLAYDHHNDKVQLQQFELLNVNSYNPSSQFIKPLAWELKFGIERPLFNSDQLNAYAAGGVGRSYKLSDEIQINTLALAKTQWSEGSELDASLGAKIGLLYQSKDFSIRSDWEQFMISTDDNLKSGKLSVQTQWHINSNFGLRTEVFKELNSDFKLQDETIWRTSLNYYF